MTYTKQNKFKETWKVIIHHSAFSTNNFKQALYNINKSHYKRFVIPYEARWYDMSKSNVNNKYPYIAYHYVIWKQWEVEYTRWIDQVGYQAWDWEVNNESIWICLIWNFEIEEPTEKQIKSLKKVLKNIRKEIWKDLKIYWHRDIKPTACPWNNLYYKLNNIMTEINKDTIEIEDKKYQEIMKKEVWEPNLFKVISWDKLLTEAEIKALIEIAYKRILEKLW